MRLKRIFVLIIATVLFCTTYVFAANPQIIIEGEQICKPNETKILKIKISSETEIGVVSGKIQTNDNITDINVTGKNGWNLTLNEGTGEFNIYKAEGSKTEEIMQIEYQTANTEGTGRITLSNLKMTTIEYDEQEIANIVKEITIKNEPLDPIVATLTSIGIKKQPRKTTYLVGDDFNENGMIIEAKYSDQTTKEITGYTVENGKKLAKGQTSIKISYTEGGVTKTVEQKIIVSENVSENGQQDKYDKYPDTGINKNVIIASAISGIISIVTYIGYKKIVVF